MLLIAAFGIGLIASFFSCIAGGAAGLIGVPLLLLLGLPPYSAVSTPKISALGISIGSLFQFYGKNLIRWSLLPGLIVLGAIAGIVGAQALLETPEYIVEQVVIVLLVVSVLLLWSRKDMGVVAFAVSGSRKFLGYIVYFFSEGLRAAFGSGFGMLTGVVLTYFFGLTNLESLATKRIPGLIVTTVALVVFLIQGVIDVPVGIAMFFGSLVGSYFGTHYAILVGDRILKYLFTVFALVMIVVLLIF